MSAPAQAGVGRLTLRLRDTPYPVVLPALRDPRRLRGRQVFNPSNPGLVILTGLAADQVVER